MSKPLYIVALVLLFGGAAVCAAAPSEHMNYYLIPGSAAVFVGGGMILWSYFRQGPNSAR